MMAINYPLTKHEFDEVDKANVINLFESEFLTMGKSVKNFEKEFAAYHGRSYGVMVNSGSSANLLLVGSLVQSGLLKTGDKVIVPAVSWSTTYFPLHQYGLKLVFVDVSLATFSLNAEHAIEAAKASGAKAIFNVPLLGSYSQAKKLSQLCDEENLIYIEDCCEAFGSSYNGDRAGSLGVGSTQSFFYSHQLPAIEGGMILTNDRILYDFMLSMRAHGWTRDLQDNSVFKIEPDPFLSAFRFVVPGYCLRPTEINAVLAQRRFELWDINGKVRKENLEAFKRHFACISGLKIQENHTGMSSFGFGAYLEDKTKRKKLVEALNAENVMSRPIVAGNFLANDAINYMSYETYGDLRNASIIDESGFFIGNFSEDLTEKLAQTAQLIDDCLNG